ncbi:MBL fold metallo-hydrolase [Halovenus halobia]|uniref:MBL fold metallo-hydrolase n=1 Tax=Halovenus halobia TaxID=3396622 RepID=UPI003F556246
MELTFLGTGSAMPTGERFQTGLLFEGSEPLLVDCGSGALHGLARTSVGYEGAETLLLTHHHLDHVSDIPALMKARWLAGAESLTIYGPPGTGDLIEGMLDTHEYMQDRLDLQVTDLDPEDAPFEIAGFEVDAMETRHSMQCLAYRFERESGPPVVFSGDSEALEELVEFADGAAVLIHDCSFPDDVDVSNHPTPSQLGRVLADADAEVGRVYLTHLYPHTDGRHEEMLESIADSYDGDVRFANDGMTLDISSTGG